MSNFANTFHCLCILPPLEIGWDMTGKKRTGQAKGYLHKIKQGKGTVLFNCKHLALCLYAFVLWSHSQ